MGRRDISHILGQIPYLQTLVAGVTFVAGLTVTAIIHTIYYGILDDPATVMWSIIGFLALAVTAGLIIALREAKERRDYQMQILSQVKTLNRRFGLRAEFATARGEANEDSSYRRVQELIKDAKKSLVFVDWWVDMVDTYTDSPERRDYYTAIEDRVNEFIRDSSQDNRSRGEVFYKRIVQLKDEDAARFAKDKVFSEHLRNVCALRNTHKEVIEVWSAKLFLHTHFALIDDEIIVQPLLSLPDMKGLKRHGALILYDQEKKLVPYYRDIIHNLERRSFDESLLEPRLNHQT